MAARPAPAPRRPLLLRRAAAFSYDLLVVAGLWMLAGFAALPLAGGEAVPAGTSWFQLLLLAVTAAYFAGSWAWGGQTVGMKAWRLRLERRDGARLGPARALGRFAAGCLSLGVAGLGVLWALVDAEGGTWHDRVADTRVCLLPKRS